jgi:hypothetical protein
VRPPVFDTLRHVTHHYFQRHIPVGSEPPRESTPSPPECAAIIVKRWLPRVRCGTAQAAGGGFTNRPVRNREVQAELETKGWA